MRHKSKPTMNFTKAACLAMVLLATLFDAKAQISTEGLLPHMNLAFDTRADFTYEKSPGQESSSGIHGRYLNVMFSGQITNQLSFSWRQRMNKYKDVENDVFTATDWIYLTYQPTKNWAISGGKQVVLIGGYEYDAAPIDIFFASVFWNNVACYQFGGSGSYITNNGNHTFTFQVCNSPYQEIGKSCYAYNLYWAGKMGCYKTLWSANLVEYARNHYCTFIALGNRLELNPLYIELDIMNRATSHHKYWFHDYSIIGKAEYDITNWMTLMLKGGYDDIHPIPGNSPIDVKKPFYGGGFEFYPWHGSRNLRIHALYSQSRQAGEKRVNEVSIGLKWRVNVFSK